MVASPRGIDAAGMGIVVRTTEVDDGAVGGGGGGVVNDEIADI